MGHNPTKNPFRAARLGIPITTQAAVDEYKARSVWGAWWQLDERIRRRYFTRDERDFVTRYGARLDEIACHRTEPRNDEERHFLSVCIGTAEPTSTRERLWLLVQMVCRYERSTERAARADLAEHDNAALRAENRALKAKSDHMELYAYSLQTELKHRDEGVVSICNVEYATSRFRVAEIVGPPTRRTVMTEAHRGAAVGLLTAAGIH